MKSRLFDRIEGAVAFLHGLGFGAPKGALVLGPELAHFLPLERVVSCEFSRLCSLSGEASVSAASSRRVLEFGFAEQMPLVVVRGGGASAADGVPLADATFPVRVAKALGASWILLANGATAIASGADSPAADATPFSPGTLVFVTDHLNWIGDNPLIGPNDDRLGPRFPDLSATYSTRLRDAAERAARAEKIEIRSGVVAGVAGPGPGTPAELRLLRFAGADLVSTSTVPDALVAVHGGLEVLALQLVTSLAPSTGVAFDPASSSASNDAPLRDGAARLETLVRALLRSGMKS